MKSLKTIKEYIALTFVLAYCYMNRDRPRKPYVQQPPRQTLAEARIMAENYIRSRYSLEDIDNCEQVIDLCIRIPHKRNPQMQYEYDALNVILDHKIHELQMVEMSEYAFVAEQKWQRRIVFN